MGLCDGANCCLHDITRAVIRDGVTHSICLECALEVDADDMPVVDSAVVPELVTGTPCGEDVPHRWGAPI